MSILSRWQEKKYPALKNESQDVLSGHEDDQAVSKFSQWVMNCDFLEGAFWLSSAYAVWVGKNKRSDQALFFTPPELAIRLIDNLVAHGADVENHTWFDPAAGGAAFLAPLSMKVREKLLENGCTHAEIVDHISNHLIGNDINPFLSYLSFEYVKMAIYDQILGADMLPRNNISTGDALICSGLSSDVVICNPPYKKLKKIQASKYSAQFGEVMEGQPNIYGVFIERCIRSVKGDGLVGVLTPTSYFAGKNFEKLRVSINEKVTVNQVDLVQDREGVFIGVLQETAISIFSKRPALKSTPEIYSYKKGDGFVKVGISDIPKNGRPWPLPRTKRDSEILKHAKGLTARLEDYDYKVKVGAYVDFRDKRETYTNLSNDLGVKSVPLIWPSDIKPGSIFNSSWSPSRDGRAAYIAVDDLNHPSVIKEPFVALQRVSSSDQRTRLIVTYAEKSFFENFDGVMGENHVLLLVPGKNSCISPRELSALLGHEKIDRLFACISGSINVSSYELKYLPLPDPKVLREAIDFHGNLIGAIDSIF
ncbi:MAG: N-6 DNA methylase [Pseudomonadota bacterium]|nr:N-6 DNA methylase [Pseudomonadota bacterium]